MEIGEIRVGNYYKSVKFNTVVKCDLSDMYDLCAKSDGAIDHPPINEMFEPIPLTAEWLFKFGFKSIDSQCNLFFSSRLLRITLPTIRCTSGICYVAVRSVRIHKHEDGFRVGITLKIKYVHELQNLFFALTGKELEFKK